MGTEPLEPKAWDGRWLAIVFVKPTKETPAHYMLYETQRAANPYEAALLTRAKWSLAHGTHMMIIGLPPEISTVVGMPTIEPEIPSPRWFEVLADVQVGLQPAPGSALHVQQVSEDAWLREIQAEWTYKEPTPPIPAKVA